jgi:L-lactate dehydrogenase complex protein LldF
MKLDPSAFVESAREALRDKQLRKALDGLPGGLVARRREARRNLPEFEALRTVGREIKNHTLDNLDFYLDAFTRKATAAGGIVHFAPTGAEAREIIYGICRISLAKSVIKSKSMVAEEISLNQHLEEKGLEVVETDLGEYLVQIRDEAPSHIIAPAIHLTEEQVEQDFRRHHKHLPADRVLDEPAKMVAEARAVLREKFLSADVGITGANFLIAETGSAVVVTNEGNADLTHTLPRVHIVIASIEKLVPTLEDAFAMLRLLARSATGQEMTAYTTLITGSKRKGDLDGPDVCHYVILDNGRSELLGSQLRDVLRCIRCGACMNHCPVYSAIGGHAYGSVYPGPIGAVLTPHLAGVKAARHLPNASSFCGACAEVCPVKIPLPDLMRVWRERDFEAGAFPLSQRIGLRTWAWLAKRPRIYHMTARFLSAILGAWGRRRGSLRILPFGRGWTKYRAFPAPQGRTFQQLWTETRRGVPR